METKKRKYVYISNVVVDGTVFQTQVLDWLHLYQKNGINFKLLHGFHFKEGWRPASIKRQLALINQSTTLRFGYFFFLPSRKLFYIINSLWILLHLMRYIFQYREILVFSRALIGKEISILRKILPAKVIFFYDARGAAAEENKYNAFKKNNYSLKKFKVVADTHYLEYKTLDEADKVFVVSRALRNYFHQTYNLEERKCILYPCLSDSDKFLYAPELRREMRNLLKIADDTKVFVYSGGIGSWHISEQIFSFFIEILRHETNAVILLLTKDENAIKQIISRFSEMDRKYIILSVPNSEVFKYLNSADFGFLFRENSVVNRVSSPTKFAEYMLCGLPVLITEGIGDYSSYVEKHGFGLLIKEHELMNPSSFDFGRLCLKNFDRSLISEMGKRNFAKLSILKDILEEFK